jgi:shikimate 5-dehydrogenase
MRIEHTLSQQLLKRGAVQVLVVGAGGTGSAVLMVRPSHERNRSQ